MKKPMPKSIPLYLADLSCQIGMDSLENDKAPEGVPSIEYALYNLLSAVQEIVKHLKERDAK